VQVGVVVGMAAEARVARGLDWQLAIGGGTTQGAEAAAVSLLTLGCTGLVSCGLAGGLDPALRPGAVIVPSTVLHDRERHPTDPELSRMLGGSTPHTLLSTASIIASAAEKRRLWQQTGAAAADQESGAVARIATIHRLPFAVLRVICDPADCSLPPAALAALDPLGAISIPRVLASIAAHPGQLPALFRLAADAGTARRSLRACVNRIALARA
jgi:adenosylhomocysteine nucleosidase